MAAVADGEIVGEGGATAAFEQRGVRARVEQRRVTDFVVARLVPCRALGEVVQFLSSSVEWFLVVFESETSHCRAIATILPIPVTRK